MNKKSDRLGRDPVWRLLADYSGPAIISMSAAATYTLVDAIFVGHLGADALAAITIAFPLTLAFTAVATGTGIGAASIISRRLGSGDTPAADHTACVAVFLSVLVSLLIMLTCLPFLELLAIRLGARDNVIPITVNYISILVYFLPIAFFQHIVAGLLRVEGRPLLASMSLIISSLANIALDPIFIFGLGPVPALEVTGAAVATVIARAIGVVIFLVYFGTGKSSYTFRPAYFRPDLKIILEIYRIGISSILRSAAMFFVIGTANTIAVGFGTLPLALMGVFLRLFRFALMPCLGIGQGMLPIMGYNYGAGQKDRVGHVIFAAGMSSLAWTTTCWTIIMLFPAQVIALFNSSPEFIAAGVTPLRIYAALFFLIGIQLIPGFFFQAIGKGFPAAMISVSRHVVFLLPLIIILPKIFGLSGLWISFPVSDLLSFIVSVAWAAVELHKQNILINCKR